MKEGLVVSRGVSVGPKTKLGMYMSIKGGKPDGRQKTKFWIHMGEYINLVKSNDERTNKNLGTP